MVTEELVKLLVCPETKQPVAIAPQASLVDLNRQISAHGLLNRGGTLFKEPLTQGLLRADGLVLYPVRNGIPLMLIEESLPVA